MVYYAKLSVKSVLTAKAIELDGWKKSEVAEIFQISRNTINLWLHRKQETGDYRALSNRPHCIKTKITNWQAFQEFVEKHGDQTQAQMAQLWGEPISPRTISLLVEENRLRAKKKDYGYKERDEDRRNEFKTEVANIEPSQRVYVDELRMDSRSDYGYGWSKRGQKFDSLKSGKRTGRVNMIAAYCQKQLFAPFTVEGSCNRSVFDTTWKVSKLEEI